MNTVVVLAALVGFVAAQSCCVPTQFTISTSLRGCGSLMFQNVSIDYNAQAIRSDEAGTYSNSSVTGTAWIFGPQNPNYQNTLFWQDLSTGDCYQEPYTWGHSQFCTNGGDYEFVQAITIGATPSAIWYSPQTDNAFVASNGCIPIQSIDNYSNQEAYVTETFYDFDPSPIPATVFKPCIVTAKGRAPIAHRDALTY